LVVRRWPTLFVLHQVVIPSEVRERLKLKPGQKVAVVEKDGVVHMIPIRPLKALKGMIAGVSGEVLRDGENRRRSSKT